MTNFIKEMVTSLAAYRVILLIAGLIAILILVQITKKNLGKRVKDSDWYKTKKIVNGIGYILFIVLVLAIYNKSLGRVAVALGVASAGIAFALQEVITSMAGWLAIIVGDFYKPGDRVQVGGIKGDVIDQGILRTTVMELGDWVEGDLYNGRIVRIANSFIFKEPVFNYSADFPFLWNEIKIPIKFGSDYDRVKVLFKEIADKITGECVVQSQAYWDEMVRKYAIENASLATMVTIRITDNWVEYTVRYIANYRERKIIQDALYSEILNAIAGHEDWVQLASATMDITELPTINMVNK